MNESMFYTNCFNTLMKSSVNVINSIGDCPNVEIHVSPSQLAWKTVCSKSGWECQVNAVSGKARVISPDGIRKANGTKNVMIEKMKRLADTEFLRRGDIIGVSRNGLYEHYAIYLGDNRVIHYCGEGNDFGGRVSVHEAPFSEFIKDSSTYFVVWFDEGRPYKIQKQTTFLLNSAFDCYEEAFQQKKRKIFSEEETIRRAKTRIGEERYNMVTNNCEHFVMWAKTGVAESSQVKHLMRFATSIEAREDGTINPKFFLA